MTSYYEDEIKKLKRIKEETEKRKEVLLKALKKIEEDQQFINRQIKLAEDILKKEKS